MHAWTRMDDVSECLAHIYIYSDAAYMFFAAKRLQQIRGVHSRQTRWEEGGNRGAMKSAETVHGNNAFRACCNT